MIIKVRVMPHAKKDEIIMGDTLKIRIRELPEEGKANKAVIKILSEHYNVKKSDIILLKGHKSRDKTFMINGKK